MNSRKATRTQVRRHNRLLILRAIYAGEADNRAALALVTGLARPTVSELVAELIEQGLVEEAGQGESSEVGGKRPTLLRFIPEARQVIGVSVDAHAVHAVLVNLDGTVVAEHEAPLDGRLGEDAYDVLVSAINGMIAQLDAPLLCIGVGVQGFVDSVAGQVVRSSTLGWRRLPLVERLTVRYQKPAYVANNTELTALAQFTLGELPSGLADTLVTVRVDETVEVGMTLQGGEVHHGGEIGGLLIGRPGPAGEFERRRIEERLNWDTIAARALALKAEFPGSILPDEGLTFMHIRYALAQDDPAAALLYDEIAAVLADTMAWTVALLDPNQVVLAGGMVDLGTPLLDRVEAQTQFLLSADRLYAHFSLAEGENLSALGAAAEAIQAELGIL
ncbi:MAG: ROK family transcriptional regulator [Anaerolineae bacterium]